MKNVSLFFVLAFCSLSVTIAQSPSPYDAYKNDFIGWKKIYHFYGFRKPQQLDNKLYSSTQLSLMDTIANWMQASYMPKGTLGDIKRRALDKIGLYNSYETSLPQSYGATAFSYMFLKKAAGKWTNETTHAYLWQIMANEVPEYHIDLLTTDKQYYFTIPGLDEGELKDPRSMQYSYKKLYDLSAHPVIGKYINMVVPDFGQPLRRNIVILSKDNRFPYVQVSIGEVLRTAEEAIPVKFAIEKKKIFEKTQGNQKEIDFYTNAELANIDKARQTLAKLKERYSKRLNEPAFLKGGDLSMIDLANREDPFTGYTLEDPVQTTTKTFPVYKVDPELQAKCKTDQPQWIYISWVGGTLQDPGFKHMHESIINNFNFDYVYNFFFAPEKVKGKLYQPLRSPDYEEKVVVQEISEKSKKNNADPNTILFEDFSSTVTGKTPPNWECSSNNEGEKAKVENPAKEDENWLTMHGNRATLKNMKPLPENFSLAYDVAVPRDFRWGGIRLQCIIGKGNNSFAIELRPGYGNHAGFCTISGNDAQVLNPIGKEYPAPGFSNNNNFNKVHIMIVKKGKTWNYSSTTAAQQKLKMLLKQPLHN
jgi:hypothetical protein